MDDVRRLDAEGRDVRVLIERIKRGDCVLVLGPRVAVKASDPAHTPLEDVLANELLAAIGRRPDDAPPNLRRAAELYYRERKDREELEVVVGDFYGGTEMTPTDLHLDLAALPFRLCVYATPDDLMYAAFAASGKSPQRGYYDFRGVPPVRLAAPTAARPLVYHLYGHYETPSSLVLTEGDLIEFLVAVIRGIPSIPDQVRSLLGEPNAPFLFIGFGFHNWYLRVLLQVLDIYGHRSKAIAFEDAQFFELPDHEQTASFFSGDRMIDFRPFRWEGFARQLRAAYEAAMPKKDAPSPPPQRNGRAPKVFLSYASEDGAAVDDLAAQLEAKGIDVWQDHQDLRAGDDWERVLFDVIGRRVDYVVVVQTAAMVSRDEGVFHQEVEAALERQSRMRAPLRFVVPVQIGACELLSTLHHLHVIDVSTPEGVGHLVESIGEDWKQRKAGGSS